MTKRTAEWTRRDRSCTCYHPHPGGRHTVDCERAWLKAEEQRRADKAYGSQGYSKYDDLVWENKKRHSKPPVSE